MNHKVLQFWREQGFPEQTAVTCAVSGGADSVAMLYLLLSLKEELRLEIRAVHFNHRLRGEESDRDEMFVRSLCASLGVPLTVSSADVAARAELTGESIEESARKERYAFFRSLGTFVATAHTAEDNLETVLLNLLRGTSLKGLCGIPAKREEFLRPLLSCTHGELLAYLSERGVPHAVDSTNLERGCVRNRLRLDVLPLLTAENPQLAQTVLRTCGLLRRDDAFLDELAVKALAEASRENGWSCSVLNAQPDAVRTRAVRLLLSDCGVRKPTARHVLALDALITRGKASSRCDLPGVTFGRRYDLLTVCPPQEPAWLPCPLEIGKTVFLASQQITISVQRVPLPEKLPENTFACRADGVDGLCVRPRQEGDAMRLSGGHRTLKRIFSDRKIPADRRGSIPVIADRNGVLAVCGIGVNLDRMARPGDDAILIKTETEGCI